LVGVASISNRGEIRIKIAQADVNTYFRDRKQNYDCIRYKVRNREAKSNSTVLMHFVIKLRAGVHHAEKWPLHANMNLKVKPLVQVP